MAKGDKKAACDVMGIDGLCERLIAGDSQAAIAAEIGVSAATLVNWISADLERSARAREARRVAASSHADKAEEVLLAAKDPFGLARARELAQHYRWKASKADPKAFGDKIEIDQRTTYTDLTDEQLDAKLAAIAHAGAKA